MISANIWRDNYVGNNNIHNGYSNHYYGRGTIEAPNYLFSEKEHEQIKKKYEMTKTEQYIKDYTRGCSNELGSTQYNDGKKIISYHEWLTPENAMTVAEIAREEVIEKACTVYCKCCDTQECEGSFECDWVDKFRNKLKREIRKQINGDKI